MKKQSLILILLFCALTSCNRSESSRDVRFFDDSHHEGESGFTSEELKKLYDEKRGCYRDGIVGGQKVEFDNPRKKHVALLWVRNENGELSTCTATLISQQVLLTAAHCIKGANVAIDVIFHNNVLCSGGMNSQLVYQVEKYIAHPSYHNEEAKSTKPTDIANYDLALIKLTANAPSNYQPIELASLQEISASRELIQIGYGKSKTREKKFPELRETIKKQMDLTFLDHSYYLVVSQKDGHGICMGDSGGPLLIKTKNSYKVAGVASFLTDIANEKTTCENSVLAYDSTVDYASWINENLQKLK